VQRLLQASPHRQMGTTCPTNLSIVN
jgi:hypothetical protein